MAYAYNAVGEVTSMTTYGYDADGEIHLLGIMLSDTILYAYDPVSSEISVTENGVVTNYVSNSVNSTPATTNGVTTTYQYDANGNLIGDHRDGQTTTSIRLMI